MVARGKSDEIGRHPWIEVQKRFRALKGRKRISQPRANRIKRIMDENTQAFFAG